MVTASEELICSFDDLKSFVYQVICRDHELLTDTFPTAEIFLNRGKAEICGVMFCLYGPRSVKFSAVWEKEGNRLFFYGSNGKRYRQVDLLNSKIEFSAGR